MATRRITKDGGDDWANDPSADLFDLLDQRLARAVRNRPNKRRPRNTGYMKEIRPHVWLLKVYRGKEQGKKRYKSETFHGLQDEAARRLTELQLRYGSNSPLRPSEMTFGTVLVLWQQSKEREWAPSTVANHRSIISRLEPLRELKPDGTAPREFSDFYERLGNEGLKPSTVTRLHSVARSSLNWAREQGYVLTNPAALVRSPGAGPSEVDTPTSAQIRQIVTAARETDPLFASLVLFTAVTGARRSEIAGLKWSDIDERDDGDFTVTFQRRISRTEVVPGLKAGKFKRVVVGADLVETVREHSVNAEWVFGTPKSHVSVGTLSRKYKRQIDALGLTDAGTYHGLRHFCGSNLFVETDMTLIEVSAHLGHSKPSTTLDLYAHVVDPDQTGGAQALEGAIAA